MATRRKLTALAAACPLIAGAGCSSKDSDSDPPAASNAQWASCDEAYNAGAKVPADAVGCITAAGTRQRYRRIDCQDGSVMFAMADDLWSVDGVVVNGNEDEFAADANACLGR